MTAPRTYLDCNATTPIRPEAVSRMAEVMAMTGNASSIHGPGRTARKIVEDARAAIATPLDVGPQQVIFNSGATEGNNTILKGFAERRVLVSAIEHLSVLESGIRAEAIPVTPDGIVDIKAFEKLVHAADPPALVSVMLVNNETGVIQPVAEIAAIAHDAGALVHCDAVQAFGKIPFTRAGIGADFITLSAHKFGGPQGVGALIMAPKAPLPKLLQGGGQERRQRAGTENVAGIAGLGVAATLAIQNLGAYQSLSALRDRLEQDLLASSQAVRIYGQHAPRVANTICFSAGGGSSETLLMAFDLEGIAISSGSACSSGTIKPSHVLKAMGMADEDAKSALRISMGWQTTSNDLETFMTAWNKIRARILM